MSEYVYWILFGLGLVYFLVKAAKQSNQRIQPSKLDSAFDSIERKIMSILRR